MFVFFSLIFFEKCGHESNCLIIVLCVGGDANLGIAEMLDVSLRVVCINSLSIYLLVKIIFKIIITN